MPQTPPKRRPSAGPQGYTRGAGPAIENEHLTEEARTRRVQMQKACQKAKTEREDADTIYMTRIKECRKLNAALKSGKEKTKEWFGKKKELKALEASVHQTEQSLKRAIPSKDQSGVTSLAAQQIETNLKSELDKFDDEYKLPRSLMVTYALRCLAMKTIKSYGNGSQTFRELDVQKSLIFDIIRHTAVSSFLEASVDEFYRGHISFNLRFEEPVSIEDPFHEGDSCKPAYMVESVSEDTLRVAMVVPDKLVSFLERKKCTSVVCLRMVHRTKVSCILGWATSPDFCDLPQWHGTERVPAHQLCLQVRTDGSQTLEKFNVQNTAASQLFVMDKPKPGVGQEPRVRRDGNDNGHRMPSRDADPMKPVFTENVRPVDRAEVAKIFEAHLQKGADTDCPEFKKAMTACNLQLQIARHTLKIVESKRRKLAATQQFETKE